jgi:hypothetical protein
MKPIILIVTLFFLLITSVSANNQLYVNDPQNWNTFQGIIEEAELTVRPMGAFVEYGLTMTISGKVSQWVSDQAQLEIVLDFDLPANSMVTDSWLWIYGEPKQAEILDRWTASGIYESIVNRRKDPSLLVKNGPNSYQIRVYPMKKDESRTFKFVYLAPAVFSSHKMQVEIPSNILNLSVDGLSQFPVYVLPNQFFGNLESENPVVEISQVNHETLGGCSLAMIPGSAFTSSRLYLESNPQEKISLYRFGNNEEGFYQISFTPSDYVDVSEQGQKICYLVDYDEVYTSNTLEQLLSQLKLSIKDNLTDNDQFNVVFSRFSSNPTFDTWMPATDANIESAFNSVQISKYSNLVNLLATGLDFINDNKGDGKILLITNNCREIKTSEANAIMADMNKLNQYNTTIDIIDFATSNYRMMWTSNTYYENNSYLFNNICRQTKGEYYQFLKRNSYSFESHIDAAIAQFAQKRVSNIDVYTSSNQGLCYGRMSFSSSLTQQYLFNRPVYHLGKYKGAYPDQLEVTFELENELYHFVTDLSGNTVLEGDSVIKTIWNGLNISNLEKQGNTNDLINEIINQSIENRILSYYTAFLCVEDDVEICEDCGDVTDGNDDEWVTQSEETENFSQLKMYPNPFNTEVVIEVPNVEKLVNLKIYNLSGQCIKTFKSVDSQSSIVWDGTDEEGKQAERGIYLVRVTYTDKVINSKLVKN